MKFILNTVLDPHFCAVFSEKNILIDKIQWVERSQGGKIIYDFLNKFDSAKFSFCGGLSGPGGFASLRLTANVLTSLSLVNNIDINQLSAGDFLFNVLKHENFLLNSFGQGVWIYKKGKISRKLLKDVNKNKDLVVQFLPLNKQKLFSSKIPFSVIDIEKKLLDNLLKTQAKESFVPHYEIPPV